MHLTDAQIIAGLKACKKLDVYSLTDHQIAMVFRKHSGVAPAPSAAEPVAVPEGWKLVPVEPTQEMCDACTRVLESEDVPGAWAEMLAAAPPAPQAASGALTMAEGIGKHGVVKQWPDVAASDLMTDEQIDAFIPGAAHQDSFSLPQVRHAIRATLSNGLTEVETSATASVAGLSGDAEREAIERAATMLGHRLGYIASGSGHRAALSALHSTGKPDGEMATVTLPRALVARMLLLEVNELHRLIDTALAATADAPVAEPVALTDVTKQLAEALEAGHCGYARIKEGEYKLAGMRSNAVMADGELHPLFTFTEAHVENIALLLSTRPPAPEEGKDAARKHEPGESIPLAQPRKRPWWHSPGY